MYQAIHIIEDLPNAPIEAAQTYFAKWHGDTLQLLGEKDTATLVILLDHAGPDHDSWRRTLAQDLARQFAPKRCNVVGSTDPEAAKELLSYLEGAHGVTGQYLAAHE